MARAKHQKRKTCPVCGESYPNELMASHFETHAPTSGEPSLVAHFQQCPKCQLFVARERTSDGRLWCPLCDGDLWKSVYKDNYDNYIKNPGPTPPRVLYGGVILLVVCVAVLTYVLMGGAAVLIATVPLLVGLIGVIYHLLHRDAEATR
jgi:ribosomal protein S27AE